MRPVKIGAERPAHGQPFLYIGTTTLDIIGKFGGRRCLGETGGGTIREKDDRRQGQRAAGVGTDSTTAYKISGLAKRPMITDQAKKLTIPRPVDFIS